MPGHRRGPRVALMRQTVTAAINRQGEAQAKPADFLTIVDLFKRRIVEGQGRQLQPYSVRVTAVST